MVAYNLFTILFSNFVHLETFTPILGITKSVCALICMGKYGCSSFFYHADEMSCVPSLSRHFNTTLLQSRNGYAYYSTRPDCNNDWEVFHGNCYYFETVGMPYELARTNCLEKEAYLANADSDVENVYFKFLSKRGSFWIGGEKVNRTWIWQDGTPIPSKFWARGEPNGSGKCLQQWKSGAGHDDTGCHLLKPSLCKK